MPIVTDSDSLTSKINGGFSNSIINSLEDEESFVVLERLTANDPGPLDVSIQSLSTIQPFSNSCSFPTFNHLSTSGPASNSNNIDQFEVPGEVLGPRFDSNMSVSAEDIQKQLQEVLRENVNLKENLFQTNLAMKQHMSTVRLLQDRASEVQKNHQAKFEETKSLILQLGSEKNELQEANTLLSGELVKAKQEIKELKDSNLAFGNEMAKILSENESLKKQVTCIQANVLSENSKKTSLQPTAKELELHELADQLTRKLEGVERSRRQQEFDIDRLKAQLGRAMQELNETQRKLAQAENSLQSEKERSSDQVKSGNSSFKYQEKLVTYSELLNQLKTTAQEEQTRYDSLSSWLAMDPVQFEISELRRLLAEEQSQSVARKKGLALAISTINDLLSDFKKIGEEIDLLKADRVVKETHSLAYYEVQKKGFNEQLDALTAKLVEKEEALAISERHLASLQEALRLQNVEKKDSFQSLKEQVQGLSNQLVVKEEQLQAYDKEISSLKSEVEKLKAIADTVTVFEEQANIYKDDFEAERKSREKLNAEKERLLEDFHHLQLRNVKLIDDLRKVQNGEHLPTAPPANVNNRQERSLSPAPPRPQDEPVPPPKRFYCPNPNCYMEFTSLGPLELHVITCLQLTD